MQAARLVADALLEVGAVHFNVDKPFLFTSGTLSPVYVDCRKLISFPKERKVVVDCAMETIELSLGKGGFDVVAGGETAGIPFAAWIADRADAPMVYVRKAPKSFGRQAQIEGELAPGQRVLLVEDLVFDAGSKRRFCEALKTAGGIVEHVLVVFDYGRAAAREELAAMGVKLHALTTCATVLDVARARTGLMHEEIEEIHRFLLDPKAWRA